MIDKTEVESSTSVTLPILQEELQVKVHPKVTGIVRLEKSVREHGQWIDQELVSQQVSVERVPVNRYLSEPAIVRQEGDTTVYPVMEEILVVTKQLVLKEEIRVTRLETLSRHQELVTLRTEEVSVDRIPSSSEE